jgi:PST family polysaccharide transporter
MTADGTGFPPGARHAGANGDHPYRESTRLYRIDHQPGPGGPAKPPRTHWIARAAWWVFAHAVSARYGVFVIGLVLAHLMSPRKFGILTVAIIALLAMRSLDYLGMRRAIITCRDDPGSVAPTAMAISLASGAAIYAASYAIAPAFARDMGASAATGLIRSLAVSVAIGAVAAVPVATLQRRSRRVVKVLAEQTDNWTGVAVTIALAVTGHGLMSLALGRIAGAAVGALLAVTFAPRALRIGFNLQAARLALRSGLPLAASGLLLFTVITADLAVVGRWLSLRDLGWYFLAICIASWPVSLCAQPVRDAAPAAFAKFRQGSQVASSAFLSSANLLACLTLPVCILISVSAGNLVHVAYGPAWAAAGPMLVWLAPLAALRVFYELFYHYIVVRVSLRVGLALQSVVVAVLLPALVTGVRKDGVLGAIIPQIVICALVLLPLYLREARNARSRFGTLLARLGAALAASGIIGGIAVSLRHSHIQASWLGLAIGAVAALAVMSLLVHRNRAALRAVRGAAAVGGGREWVTDAVAPMLISAVEPSRYAVLTLVPPHQPAQATAGQAPGQGSGGEQEGLGHKVKRGARWSLANTAVMRVATFATTILLARTVFGPQAFGLYAVSQVILAVLLSANEMGVSLAIVRWDGDVREFAPTVVTLATASSVLLYCVLYVLAPQAASLLGTPTATEMIRVLSLCVIIDGLACVPLALLTRTFAQRRLMAVNGLNFVISTGVTLWLAFAGWGAISFAWGSVAGCTAALIAALFSAPFLALPGWNSGQARKLLRFGLPLAGASLLMLGVFNVDSAIVGAMLGPVSLGLYQLAFNISGWPSRSISEAARRVSFAGFSRVAHSADLLTDAYARAIGLVMTAAVPACVLLAALAEPLIRTVYGQRWTPAAPVLTWLAILGLFRVAYELTYDCLAAAGKRPTLLGVQGWWLAVLIPILLIGARTRGIVGVGIGHVLVAGPLVLPAFLWALSRCGIGVRPVLAACWRPVLGGVIMVTVAELVLHATGETTAGAAMAAGAALAAYLPVVFPMRGLLRRRPAPAAPIPDEVRAA